MATIAGSFEGDGLVGTNEADIMYGLDGNDFLNGLGGNDYMDGGRGADLYSVDSINDVVVEGFSSNEFTEFDTVYATIDYTLEANVEGLLLLSSPATRGYGNSLDNSIFGNEGNNFLYGKGGNDMLEGGRGNDELFGGRGNDSLEGTTRFGGSVDERDKLTGGGGADTFVLGGPTESYYIGNGNSHAIIRDFNAIQDDKIELFGDLADYTFETQNVIGSSALDTVISLDGDRIGIIKDFTALDTSYYILI